MIADLLKTFQFFNIFKVTNKTAIEKAVLQAFLIFQNGDGYISSDELHYVVVNVGEKLSEAEVEQMMKAADIDGDGRVRFCLTFALNACIQLYPIFQIDYNEFVKMMSRQRKSVKKP